MWLFVEVGKEVSLAGIDVRGVCVCIVTPHGACPWEEEISMHQHVGAWLLHPHCPPSTMAFPASEAFLPLCLTQSTWASTHHFLDQLFMRRGEEKDWEQLEEEGREEGVFRWTWLCSSTYPHPIQIFSSSLLFPFYTPPSLALHLTASIFLPSFSNSASCFSYFSFLSLFLSFLLSLLFCLTFSHCSSLR